MALGPYWAKSSIAPDSTPWSIALFNSGTETPASLAISINCSLSCEPSRIDSMSAPRCSNLRSLITFWALAASPVYTLNFSSEFLTGPKSRIFWPAPLRPVLSDAYLAAWNGAVIALVGRAVNGSPIILRPTSVVNSNAFPTGTPPGENSFTPSGYRERTSSEKDLENGSCHPSFAPSNALSMKGSLSSVTVGAWETHS